MVIGAIIQHGKGYKFASTASVNGINKTGIEITLQGLDDKFYTMKTKSDGLYYSTNIPEGVYKIIKFYLKNTSGGSWASITYTISADTELKVEITAGKVNNLGTINWECEKNVKNTISFNREYEQVKEIFQENNKSSNWNEKEWIDIKTIKKNL